MDFNRFTESMQQALSAAQTKAVRYGHQQIDVEHLLVALLEQERGLATSIFTKADVTTDSLQRRAERGSKRNAARPQAFSPRPTCLRTVSNGASSRSWNVYQKSVVGLVRLPI